MQKRKTKEWVFMCLNCGHPMDKHNVNSCQMITHREYPSGGFLFSQSDIKSERVECDCQVAHAERVLMKVETTWE